MFGKDGNKVVAARWKLVEREESSNRLFSGASLRMDVACALAALGRPADALTALGPVLGLSGVDAGGNVLDGLRAEALALAARFAEATADPVGARGHADAFAATAEDVAADVAHATQALAQGAGAALPMGLYGWRAGLAELAAAHLRGASTAAAVWDEALAALGEKLGSRKPAKPKAARGARRWTASRLHATVAAAGEEEPGPVGALFRTASEALEAAGKNRYTTFAHAASLAGALLGAGLHDDVLGLAGVLASPEAQKRHAGARFSAKDLEEFVASVRADRPAPPAFLGARGSFGGSDAEDAAQWRQIVEQLAADAQAFAEVPSPPPTRVFDAGTTAISLLDASAAATDAAARTRAFATLVEVHLPALARVLAQRGRARRRGVEP